MTELDDAMRDAGGFGICQILFVLSASTFMCLAGANMGATIFEAYTPPAQCKSPFESKAKEICPDAYRKLLVPERDGELTACYRYDFTETTMYESIGNEFESNDTGRTACGYEVNNSNTRVVPCESWSYDRSVMRSTIVTDFNLVCGNQWGSYLSQSALMMGVGIGSILTGYISDRFGRRFALLVSCIATAIIGSLLSLTSSYLAYSITRGLFGLFAYSPFLVLFVHALELTIPKYRSVVAQGLQLSFPIGFAYLTLVSYYLREWRNIQLALSLPSMATLVIWWFSPESPRWLIMKNRESEASNVLARIYRINRTKPRSSAQSKVFPIKSMSECQSGSFKLLFSSPSLRSVSVRLFYNWFAVSCVYYGLTLNAAELSGDPFTNLILNSATETAAGLLTIPLVNICGRRLTGSVSLMLAGVLCILVQVVSQKIASTALATISKFPITIGFSTIFITTSEIYPTEIRNFATGICSAMARLGGVISPLIAMSALIREELPYVIFGILAIFAGVVLLTVPETKGVPLPQTIDDGAEFVLKHQATCFSIRTGKIHHELVETSLKTTGDV